jgi:hypothetical protein
MQNLVENWQLLHKQHIDVEKFNLRNSGALRVRKQYHIKISNRFAAWENLNYSEDTNRAWENIKKK